MVCGTTLRYVFTKAPAGAHRAAHTIIRGIRLCYVHTHDPVGKRRVAQRLAVLVRIPFRLTIQFERTGLHKRARYSFVVRSY